MRSLISDHVSTDLFNCWGHILNRKEEDKASSSPLRFAHVTTNRIFIEAQMVAKSKKFEVVRRFKVDEYVRKNHPIEGIDSGIHMMRNMETYAGNGRSFNNGLSTNVRPNIILVNKLKVKYCHCVLTFHQNQLLNRINLHVKEMRTSIKTRLAGKSVDYSDENLLNYAFRRGNSDVGNFDVLVDTKWGQVTRTGMATLKPRKWVMDMVIDLYGIYSTISKPDCLYIPTSSKFAKSDKHSTIGVQYIKMTYMPEDGSGIKKVFLPLSFNNHWVLNVVDFEEKSVYVLDSLFDMKSYVEKYEFTSEVVNNVAEILLKQKGYEHMIQMVHFGQI